MSIESVIKQELSGTRHSTVLVSERKLVKRLVLKQFQGAIDLLMHISGLIHFEECVFTFSTKVISAIFRDRLIRR